MLRCEGTSAFGPLGYRVSFWIEQYNQPCYAEDMITTSSSLVLVIQSRAARFRSLMAERPTIVRVRAGEKIVSYRDKSVVLGPGRLGVLPARFALEIENRPPPGGRYVASALLPDPDLIERMVPDGLPDGNPFSFTTDDRAMAAFERAAAAVDDPLMPTSLRDHAVREIVLWLADAGIGFGPREVKSFQDRLRAVIGSELDTQWKAGEAARALAVSEATMRRRLEREGTTFTDVLADVRMSHALGLLQTTDQSVGHVALAVGYASPSRFAERFRSRFGILPSALRTAQEEQVFTAPSSEY